MRQAKSERRKGQKGSALVESALTFLPFFALMFGIVDFGMAVFLRTTFQHAAREGVRYAVTYQTLSGYGHDESIRARVRDQSMGFLRAGMTCGGGECIQINYYNPTTLAPITTNSEGSIVEVTINNYQWGVLAPVLRSANPIPITARASDRTESLPPGVNVPAR